MNKYEAMEPIKNKIHYEIMTLQEIEQDINQWYESIPIKDDPDIESWDKMLSYCYDIGRQLHTLHHIVHDIVKLKEDV